MKLSDWVAQELIPVLFQCVDRIFPEHDFRRFPGGWCSKTYLDGAPHRRKDKTVINKNKPNLILEQGGQVLPLEKYVMERDQVDYVNAVKHLADCVNMTLPGKDDVFSPYTPKKTKTRNRPKKPKIAYFDKKELEKTLKGSRLKRNTFVHNLLYNVPFPFPAQAIWPIIRKYKIGTNPQGDICFPYIDHKGNIRGIQEKKFNKDNKTDKSQKYHTGWTHSRLLHKELKYSKKPKWLIDYKKYGAPASCLFGEHLLPKFPNAPIALVEDPKTAIYGELYFGHYRATEDWLWIAVFNKSSFSYEKLKVLQGRKVIVFPDLSKNGSTFEDWRRKIDHYRNKLINTQFYFFDLLEKLAPQQAKMAGKDLADFLIQLDWRKFRQ